MCTLGNGYTNIKPIIGFGSFSKAKGVRLSIYFLVINFKVREYKTLCLKGLYVLEQMKIRSEGVGIFYEKIPIFLYKADCFKLLDSLGFLAWVTLVVLYLYITIG